ncbi:hypothetical protein ACWKYD_02670 [Enterobacter cloacae]
MTLSLIKPLKRRRVKQVINVVSGQQLPHFAWPPAHFQHGWELTLPQRGIRRQTGSKIDRIAAVKRLLRLLRIQKVGRNRNIAGVDYLRMAADQPDIVGKMVL